MLSIIVSSYQPHYYAALEKSIAETCGLPFEIIKIDNPSLMSITKAYNLGAQKAQYKNLLFLHEDVIFHCQNWGEKLITHLSEDNTGIIGVAGSSYVPEAPSSWTVSQKYNVVNILQGNKKNSDATHHKSTTINKNKVFAVDGVFLALKKDTCMHFKFDENLEGFHGYDLDISLRISKKFQNYVVDDILIQHFSTGNLNQSWLDSNIRIRKSLGASFHTKTDNQVEINSFLGFLFNYFKHYAINRKNFFFTLNFYPYKKIKVRDHFIIIKRYFQYIRYAGDINKKKFRNNN